MKPELRRVGDSQSPVIVVDDFTGDAERLARAADSLAPFPRETNSYYPGVRRMIDEGEPQAFDLVAQCCRDAAQFIAGAFDVESFRLLRASFSIVTVDPNQLTPQQRAPHFDSTDPKYLALLLYLRVPEGSGTAFYRQRSTGIEVVTEDNVDSFFARGGGNAPPGSGYIRGSNDSYEQIGAIEAVPDRLVIYQGSLLHSGIIPPDIVLSPDPRAGRLTCNIFVRGQ